MSDDYFVSIFALLRLLCILYIHTRGTLQLHHSNICEAIALHVAYHCTHTWYTRMSDCLHCAHTQKVRLYKIDTQIRNWKKYIIHVVVASTYCNQTINFQTSLSLMHLNYTRCCWSSIECNRTNQLRSECKRILHLDERLRDQQQQKHTQFQRTTTLYAYALTLVALL